MIKLVVFVTQYVSGVPMVVNTGILLPPMQTSRHFNMMHLYHVGQFQLSWRYFATTSLLYYEGTNFISLKLFVNTQTDGACVWKLSDDLNDIELDKIFFF